MNDTLWWDGVDGDSLVCRPGNENDKECALACLVVTRIIPTIWFCCGICFFHMAWLQLKLARNVHPIHPTKAPRGESHIKPTRQHGKHGAMFAFLLGIETLAAACSFVINGHGTIYASDTLLGIIGDCFLAIYCSVIWYLAFIQVQGAKWFKGLTQFPSGQNNKTRRKCLCFGVPSVTEMLDGFQSRYGPIFSLIVCIFLAVGVFPRSWCYFAGHLLTAGFSLRAFFAFATQRVSALRKVANMQNIVRGTAADKKRRRRILRSKVFGLVGDLFGVIIINVVPNFSVLILRSPFSSRLLIVNLALVLPIVALGACAVVVAMYVGIMKKKKEQQRISFNSSQDKLTESRISALSVLDKSLETMYR